MARARKTLRERGQEALQRNNFQYALKLYWQYLANNPGDVEARQELRAAEIQRLKEKKPSALTKALGGILAVPNRILVALMKAALSGHSDNAKLLLAAGADVHAESKDKGKTALHIATEHGHSRIAVLLIEAGANVHAKTKEGMTALMIAKKSGRRAYIVKILKEHGAEE